MSNIRNTDIQLDVASLPCPLPMLRIKASLGRIASGQNLQVLGLAFAHLQDVQGWCLRNNHDVDIKESSNRQHFNIIIKKN